MALRADEVVSLKGKDFPLYKGVLREAHENGLLALEVTVLQYPSEANGQSAVCQAIATFSGPDGRDRVFCEIGDADPRNCGAMIVPHRIRMSATRAKGRALRDALGIGECTAEELGDAGPAEAYRPEPRKSGPVRHEKPPREIDENGVAELERPIVDDYDRTTGEFYCGDCGQQLNDKEIATSRKYGIPMSCLKHGRTRAEHKLAMSPAV